MSDDRSTDADAPGGADVLRDTAGTTPPRRRVGPAWLACVLAAAAGLLAFALGELSYGVFQARSVRMQRGLGMSDRPTVETKEAAMVRNSALAYAEWGALLGLSLGLAGSLLHHSPRRGALVGMVGGGVVGAILSLTALPLALRANRAPVTDPLIIGTLAQAVIWGLIAAAAGFGFGHASGVDRRTTLRYALAAMGGAAVGAVVYGVIGASFYPLAESDQPLATEWQPRLLARLLPALGAAIAIEWTGANGRRSRPRTAA
ncbi:MAG: hypothetical protein U0790_12475 [Isosphaeraceae bacterium]